MKSTRSKAGKLGRRFWRMVVITASTVVPAIYLVGTTVASLATHAQTVQTRCLQIMHSDHLPFLGRRNKKRCTRQRFWKINFNFLFLSSLLKSVHDVLGNRVFRLPELLDFCFSKHPGKPSRQPCAFHLHQKLTCR